MNGIVFHGNHIKVKEQKKKEENETINLSYQINQNGSSRSSISTVNQSISSSTSSGNLSLLENINSMNFYPKNLNIKINNNNYYGNNNAFSLNDNKFEIFEFLDQETLYKKIRYAIEKMKEHYCYYYMGDKSKLKSKNNILFY